MLSQLKQGRLSSGEVYFIALHTTGSWKCQLANKKEIRKNSTVGVFFFKRASTFKNRSRIRSKSWTVKPWRVGEIKVKEARPNTS